MSHPLAIDNFLTKGVGVELTSREEVGILREGGLDKGPLSRAKYCGREG